MKTIAEHLAGTPLDPFLRKVATQRSLEKWPKFLAKPVSKLVWSGGYQHLKKFDHDYTFSREGTDLVSMSRNGEEVKRFERLGDLIGPMDRPVSLVTLGPSAKEHDWEAVKASGRMIVAVSGGGTFLKERGITPDLLVVSDPDFSKAAGYHVVNVPGVPLVIEYRAAAALHRHFPEALEGRRIAVIERVNKWYGLPAFDRDGLDKVNAASGSPFHISDVPDKLLRAGWSDRPEWGFFPSATVAIMALQVIIALGAKDIEIIGMDLGGGNSLYSDVGKSRLAEEYQAVILPSFLEMGEALSGKGTDIRNLSPTCPLPPSVFKI
ncbi:MAG TPA: hypothetical protein VM511_10680 [Luteolibacter sp.]|nr:hypothetical protein [Luteolibacter sp.]